MKWTFGGNQKVEPCRSLAKSRELYCTNLVLMGRMELMRRMGKMFFKGRASGSGWRSSHLQKAYEIWKLVNLVNFFDVLVGLQRLVPTYTKPLATH